LEEIVQQHPAMAFGGKSVNTVRVYSVVDGKGGVHILKAVLRAGVGDSIVDNYHSGGVIYPVNVRHGFIEGPGIQRGNEQSVFVHPGTSKIMLGFAIPHWAELLSTVEEMATALPQVRYIGWDLAITQSGVELIEANDTADHALLGCIGQERFFYDRIMNLR